MTAGNFQQSQVNKVQLANVHCHDATPANGKADSDPHQRQLDEADEEQERLHAVNKTKTFRDLIAMNFFI